MLGSSARRVAVIGGIRIPFCRAHTAYARCSNQDMMTAVLQALVARYSLKGERLGDVSLGAVIKHSRDFNLARESTLSSGLAPETPAFDIQRACGTHRVTQMWFDRCDGHRALVGVRECRPNRRRFDRVRRDVPHPVRHDHVRAIGLG